LISDIKASALNPSLFIGPDGHITATRPDNGRQVRQHEHLDGNVPYRPMGRSLTVDLLIDHTP
jgi:hypothetical protein